jgi:4-azaleucine resistance transporter AzlC
LATTPTGLSTITDRRDLHTHGTDIRSRVTRYRLGVPDISRRISAKAWSIGLATGAYGLSFGAISVASGLTAVQTQALSLFMFTGASQFALVGVLGTGGGLVAAVLTAWFLGARNGLYALSLAPTLRGSWWQRMALAHWTIDETTAMALAHPEPPRAHRHAFWQTGLAIYVLWNLGTLIGALSAAVLPEPRTLGLDAAIPAAFIALLWPRLTTRTTWAVAAASAAVAITLTPVLRPGLPVLACALVAVAAASLVKERRP